MEEVNKLSENQSPLVDLYVLESGAGATTPIMYHYYLIGADESAKRFTAEDIHGDNAFLVTSDGKATLDVINTDIYLKVSGDIFRFNNRGIFKYEDRIYSIRVFLDAEPK